MTTSSIQAVAVLGLGTMGQGIAAAAAFVGTRLQVFDHQDSLDDQIDALHRRYERLCSARGGNDSPPLDVCAAGSVAEAGQGADLVIEAVPEDMTLKRSVLAELAGGASAELIVATNTSSLPLAAFADAVPDPSRFLATHFFNPAELVPGVEVAAAPAVRADVVERVMAFLRHIGKDPIRVGTGAGFVANRLQLALFLEAMACVEDGTATPEDVDMVVRRTFGFRLPAYGPFAVADMAGLDVYASILGVLRETYGDRFAMPETMRNLVEQGRFGVKADVGFRDYTPGEIDELLASRDERYRRILAAADG